MARQIIDGTAAYINLPGGGKCLDVGCGSGALTIAVAKRNPRAEVIGVDRWGKRYAERNRDKVIKESFAARCGCTVPLSMQVVSYRSGFFHNRG